MLWRNKRSVLAHIRRLFVVRGFNARIFHRGKAQSAMEREERGENEETDEREFKRRHKGNVIKVASCDTGVLKNWCLREINFSLSGRTERIDKSGQHSRNGIYDRAHHLGTRHLGFSVRRHR